MTASCESQNVSPCYLLIGSEGSWNTSTYAPGIKFRRDSLFALLRITKDLVLKAQLGLKQIKDVVQAKD
jgi:hypothetical protein